MRTKDLREDSDITQREISWTDVKQRTLQKIKLGAFAPSFIFIDLRVLPFCSLFCRHSLYVLFGVERLCTAVYVKKILTVRSLIKTLLVSSGIAEATKCALFDKRCSLSIILYLANYLFPTSISFLKITPYIISYFLKICNIFLFFYIFF